MSDLADRGKFESITRRINGGTNGIDDRRRYLKRAWQRFGEGPLPLDEGRSNLLDEGDSGPKVSALQQRLTELGYHNGAVDGHFGPLTGRALLAFQSENDLEADAIAGAQTLVALEKASSSEPLPRVNATAGQLRAKGCTTIKLPMHCKRLPLQPLSPERSKARLTPGPWAGWKTSAAASRR